MLISCFKSTGKIKKLFCVIDYLIYLMFVWAMYFFHIYVYTPVQKIGVGKVFESVYYHI